MGHSASTEDDVLEEATRRLVYEFHPLRVYLFGSRAGGEVREDSDYDFYIVVSKEEEGRTDGIRRAHDALRDMQIPTDVVIRAEDHFRRFESVKPALEYEVATNGRLLYG